MGLIFLTGLLTTGTILTVAVNVEVLAKLPPELLQWLVNPANINSDNPPAELENYLGGSGNVITQSVPVALALLVQLYGGEFAHALVARLRKVRLGVPYFIPSQVLGSLGGLTPLRSIVPNRTALWDVAVAGPLVSGGISLAVFIAGLSLSLTADKQELIQIPQAVLQGSLLLGGLTKLVIPASGANLAIHPLLVAGWAGMYTSALNLLPVGSLDGGRMVQAAWGRSTLALTSFFTYICLALGFIASQVALAFGLYVLILQRQPERQIRNSITPATGPRQVATAVLLGLSLLLLLPNIPDPDTLGGPASLL